ncbi:MAG TPA: TadE/TadG family type IV pilus assembly protein [Caulobacteraceae bacterium]|nr:TadE/TadG family type IV pilus assembly protein [Caulobacteraceae bacterium]
MPAGKPTLQLREVRRLAGDAAGATAVEFAIVAVPFLALMFSILELGLIFMASTTIEASTVAAARLIRTGQLQAGSNNTADGFKTIVCNGMSWISTSDCVANISLDVRTFPSFSKIDVTPPISGGQIDQSQLTFDSGASCDIVLVRAFYPWTLLTPVLEPGLPNLGPTQRLLTATVAFRNENWTGGGASC